MRTTKMLKKNYEFRNVLTKGICFSGNFINAFIIKNNKDYNELGLAISTKVGKAYQRNKIKRLIRENYKEIELEIIKGYSIAFLVRKNIDINKINYINIKKDIIKIFNNSKLIKVD